MLRTVGPALLLCLKWQFGATITWTKAKIFQLKFQSSIYPPVPESIKRNPSAGNQTIDNYNSQWSDADNMFG